jgi:hypothetical protein
VIGCVWDEEAGGRVGARRGGGVSRGAFFCLWWQSAWVVSHGVSQSIAGMQTAEVLRKQKQGLMLRLAEQKRQLAALAEQVGSLQRARDEAEGAAGTLRRAWDALETQLRLFVARLEPGASLGDLAPDSKVRREGLCRVERSVDR